MYAHIHIDTDTQKCTQTYKHKHVHRHTRILISKRYVLKNTKKGFNEYRREGWKKYTNCGWGNDSLGKNTGYASSKA